MTATMPVRPDVRGCRLYRFYGWDPRTNYTTKTLIYIGETAREPFERLMEHVDDKPWQDTITSWEVDDRVFPGKAAVLEAEAAAIRAERPLYNVRGNEQNQQRIIPPDAIRQRRARDAAKGAPRWVHPGDRQARLAPTVRAPARRRWSPVQVKTALWFTGWALTAVAGWVGSARAGLFPTWWADATAGATAALLLVLWLLAGAPITRRQRRRAWRRLSRRRSR